MSTDEKGILKRLAKIVGSEQVVTDEGALLPYGSDQSFVKPRAPLFAVKPASREEVQKIIHLANQKGIGIVPYSSGTTLQGAHIPSSTAITIDLSRMNTIHLIDPMSRNVILEPGVTFSQLQDELKPLCLRVLTPVGVSSAASVIGTYIEFTPLFSWPKYGAWETLTMEIVLPDGQVMGTGQMAVKAAEHPYTWTTPYAVVNRMFFSTQGTLGVVTKAAVTVKTLHPAARVFFVRCDNLPAMAEAVRAFMRPDVAEEVFVANPHYLSLFLAKEYPEDYRKLRDTSSPWTVVMVVRGEEEEVEVKTADLQDVASSVKVRMEQELPGCPDAGERVLEEIAYPKGFMNQNRFKGAWNPIFSYMTRENLQPSYDLVIKSADAHHYPSGDVGIFILPLNHGATFYFEPGYYRNPQDGNESQKTRELFLEVSEKIIKQGAFFDRPYPLWAKQVYDRTPKYHGELRKIKKMLDPNNIMNPGKLAFE
jgi:FAD/FMN-containing dehydrogenase